MSRFRKLTAAFLCLALLLLPIPDKVSGEEVQELPSLHQATAPKILREVVDKRERNVKHFLREDWTTLAAVYPDAVHFEEQGKLVEMDNRLESGTDELGTLVLQNRKNAFQVRFAKTSQAAKLVAIKKGSYGLSWSLVGGAAVKVQEERPAQEAPQTLPALPNLQSTVRYPEILPGMDLVYTVRSEEIKENLVVKQRQAVPAISFDFTLKNLVPQLQADQTILLRDARTQEPVMVMPAPFMVDAAGEVSYGVTVTLIAQTGAGAYRLSLTPDAAWLAEESRVYPVLVDPVVKTTVDEMKIFDAPVSSAAPNTNYKTLGLLKAGYGSSSQINRSFLQFTLPTLTTADLILGAELTLATFSALPAPRQIEAYPVLGDWSSSTLTWNNKPPYDGAEAQDYQFVSGPSGSVFSWDITKLVKSWYATGINRGLMLKNAREYTSADYADFHSSDTSYGAPYRPQITLAYVNQSGLEGYWSYHAQDLGRAGTAYVQDHSGNVVLVHEDLALSGARLPLAIQHVWNGHEAKVDQGFGTGWRTNLSQTVTAMVLEGVSYYVYTDGDGTIHYFVPEGSAGTYRDESGLDLTLTVNGGSAEPFVLTDKGGNRLIFNSAGKLTHLKDLENNTLQVQYSAEGRIQSVTDGSGRTALLGFSEGRLQEITDPAGRKLRFGYRGAQLVSITYPDGKVTTYDYDGEMKLRSAVRPDGYRMEWTYYGIAPYRVRTMAETGAAGALGGSLTLTYGYNTTTLTDRAGRSQTLQFNAQGNPVSLRDEGGYGAYFGYGTSGGTRNKLTLESKVQRTVLNTLQNPSGESTSAWQIVQHNGSQGTLVADSLAKTSGNSSLRITKTGAGGTVFAEQEVTLTRGKTYTLSAKLKTDSISAGNAMGALVAVRYTDGHGWKYAYGRYVSGTKDWARVEVTFTLEAQALSPQVVACVGIEGESGTAWFDELQLEEGEMANRFNLLENSDFTQGLTRWSTMGLVAGDGVVQSPDPAHPASFSDAVLSITGGASTAKSVLQTVPVSGAAGEVFVLGGWARGASVPLTGERKFALTLAIQRTDGTVQWARTAFNRDTQDWQYLCTPVLTDSAYTGVSVVVEYGQNLNSAAFDGLQLYREEFGQSYQYDAQGNLVATADLAKANTTFQYNTSHDLVKTVDPQGNFSTYTYSTEGKRRLTEAVTAEGVTYQFAYDDFGNPRQAVVQGNVYRMTATSQATASGAYVERVTDSAGSTVTYAYVEDRGILSSVTDPEGRVTTYTHDPQTDALTGVSTSVDGRPLSLSYSYADDRLRSITHHGFTYTFRYDDLGQATGVDVGNQALVTRSYDPASGRLLQTTYGNGDRESWVYDALDRVTAAKVWNETTGQEEVRFRYGYDASGNLGVLEDVVQGVRYRYHYDLADRLTEVEGSDGSRHVQRYDQNSQLQSLTQIQGQRSQTMAYAYDRDHRPTSVTLSSGAQGTMVYDDLGRITGKTWIMGTTPVQQMNLTYVPVGLTPDLGVQYTGYVENQGWQGWKTDGQVSGTTGLALKYQRVRIALTNVPTDPQDPLASVKIRYRTHVSDVGWTGWVEDGAESGAIADDGRIEAMEIELVNAPEGYHVRYQAHVQSFGWEEPVMDGQEAGTTGQALRMEALKLTVVKDGAGETTSRVAALEGPGGTVRYTYDARGNLSTLTEGDALATYTYNALNELVREDQAGRQETVLYTYDDGGNLRTKSVHAYTLGEVGPAQKTVVYTYGNENWKDQLTAYDGKPITYDAIGNPLSYDGWTYTWDQGRQLQSLSKGTDTLSFAYNAAGQRIEKTVNGVTTRYILSGTQVAYEMQGNDTLHYSRDGQGGLFALTWNEETYFYVHNLQGDVIGLLDRTGALVVRYTYDTWGKPLTVEGSLAETLGQKNPYRYRGYSYDEETGLYYVGARYYDPVIARWLSPEPNVDFGGFDDGAGFLAYNVYAYCANNPVMFMDKTGESITLACILISGGIGLLAGGHFAAKASKAKLGYVNGWWVLGGMVVGGGVGALLGWGVGYAATAIGIYLTAGSGGTLGTVIYSNWQQAEQALRRAYNGIVQTFNTPFGKRIVDSFSRNVIREAKYGYQGLSQFIQQEINKDVWILNNTSVKSIEWHFYWSQVSNSGGPSGPLLKELLRHGIKVIFH